MSKIAINNEIVLMRSVIRQCRVSVVRKLVKEAKLLRAREHGDTKTLEKCKRKAERLGVEITAVKKIKEDEISKFGITETRSLQEILTDPNAEPSTRIMARIAFHKMLQQRISQLKEKFPDYLEYLGPGRKKLSKLQRKGIRDARSGTKESGQSKEEELPKTGSSENGIGTEVNEDSSRKEEEDIEESKNLSDSEDSPDSENSRSKGNEFNRDISEPGSILRIKPSRSHCENQKNNTEGAEESTEKPKKREKPGKTKKSNEPDPTVKIPVQAKKSIPIKVVSEEATVKRFTDLIDNKESSEIVKQAATSTKTRKNDVQIEKQVDSFFMTENGDAEYMSVVVPKFEIAENEEEEDRFGRNHGAKRQKTFNERNDKYFSKIDNRKSSFSNARDPVKNPPRPGMNSMKNPKHLKTEFAKKNDEEEELHPSWAARKKQQEILKQGFQGKKIVFDD